MKTIGNPKLLSPLTLAFVGDTVYELMVREMLVQKGDMPAGVLHTKAVQKVCASYQSEAYEKVEHQLTEEEMAVLKRGRNAHGARVPKNSNPADYRRATGLEALFGYLYLKGEIERIHELFAAIMTEQA